jgi:lysophospholipase L1-like esterase
MKRMLRPSCIVVSSVAAAALLKSRVYTQFHLPTRRSDLVRWLVAALMLTYPIVTFERVAPAWTIASLALFALALALQWTRWVMVRTHALWLSAFLVLQALLTPQLHGDFVTLPPHMRSTLDVRKADLPGVPPGVRHISTDERGFRVNPRVDYRAKRGLRIFAIGGSTTEDILLDDQSTWSHLLQEGIAKQGKLVEAINTGVSGLRAANHLATLRVVARLEPDLIIFLLGANDWNKHIRDWFEPGRNSWKPVALRHSAVGMILDEKVISPARRKLTGRAWADQARVVDEGLPWSKQPSLLRPVTHTFRPAEVAADYAATLREISRLCKESRLTCLFMTQPHAYAKATPAELRSRFWMTPPEATYTLDLESMIHIASLYNEFLRSFAAREDHPLCDLAAGMEPLPGYYTDDMHSTNDGARRIAEMVLPCALNALAGKR